MVAREIPPKHFVRFDLKAVRGGVAAHVRLRTAAPVRVSLAVKRPLAPPKAYGLQPFQVGPAAPTLPSTQLFAVCGVLSGRVQASLLVEPAPRRGAPARVRLQLASTRPQPQLLTAGWAQRPPVVRTRFTDEQRAMLVELFNKPERPNDTQMHDAFKARFSNANGPYARSLQLTRPQIKSFMSTEKARRQKAAAKGVVAEALQDGALEAEDGDECEGEGDEAEAQRREAAFRDAHGVGTTGGDALSCPAMRKAATALGWGAEAKAAKGKKAVLAVLQQAQAAPRPVAEESPQAPANGGSESSSDEGEEEDALQGSDVYEVDMLRAKRRRAGVTEYLVKWKGCRKLGLICAAIPAPPSLSEQT